MLVRVLFRLFAARVNLATALVAGPVACSGNLQICWISCGGREFMTDCVFATLLVGVREHGA